jgi:plasmid stabilization system protein ParE
MRFVVHATEAAGIDAREAADWYESRQPGLGENFTAEVGAVIRNLRQDALLHPVRFSDVRRAGLQKFSAYGVFYVVRELEVTVFAIVHGARSPKRIRHRRGRLG